jgi:hypothetical protein
MRVVGSSAGVAPVYIGVIVGLGALVLGVGVAVSVLYVRRRGNLSRVTKVDSKSDSGRYVGLEGLWGGYVGEGGGGRGTTVGSREGFLPVRVSMWTR